MYTENYKGLAILVIVLTMVFVFLQFQRPSLSDLISEKKQQNSDTQNQQMSDTEQQTGSPAPTSTPSPTPSPTPFTQYTVPTIPDKQNITVLFVGDSMTKALGPHPAHFSSLMNDEFDKVFAIDNYSEGSVNITALPRLLKEKTDLNGTQENPALEREFDILVIESFAHNPLSHLDLEAGLQKQEDVLDEMMLEIIQTRPTALIIFLATLPPDSGNYARGVFDLSDKLRSEFVSERITYLENFIEYANAHNIPLVNVYEQSFLENGTLDSTLISEDNIHPSQKGIEFIQERIFEFIVANEYL